MPLEFPKLRCAIFIVAFIVLLVLSRNLFKETLLQLSHDWTMSFGGGRDYLDIENVSPKLTFFKKFDDFTDGDYFKCYFLALCAFTSRERFWYYGLAVAAAEFLKVDVKLAQSDPRPVSLFADFPRSACDKGFGSPAGHTLRGSLLLCLLIPDLFFASDWSRKKYPQINTMTPRTHPITFLLSSTLLIVFYFVNWYDIIYTGRHSIQQGITGTVVGAWCGCFFHFVLRDSLFKHFTRLTFKAGILSGKQALLYCLCATGVLMSLVTIQCVIAKVMMERIEFEQAWLRNEVNTCGTAIPVDENGLLVGDKDQAYRYRMATAAEYVAYLGLYVGQVAFRYFGRGRLDTESYTPKHGLFN